MDRLAKETVSNVLSRLPVKDLMRCKCVCKSWFDLITDPHFISNHYLFYNSLEVQQQEHLLLCRTSSPEMSILSWNPNEPNGLVSSLVLNPPPPHEHGCWSEIMGPCNGIYFLSYHHLIYPDQYIIMNPSLRQFITLPPGPHFQKPRGINIRSSGFGYDPKTNDYKIVIIRPISMTITTKWIIELYSVNSNSWKILEDNSIPFPFALLSDRSRVFTYVNNCFHWWGCLHKSNKEQSDNVWSVKDESDDIECAVLSFDMTSELFRMIKMPKMPIITPPLTLRNHSNLIGLIVTSDKSIIPFSESTTVGIIDCYGVNQGTERRFCFDVWMLKDYWDEESWIKLYSVRPMSVIYRRIIGYHGSNQYLWIEAYKKLVLSGLDWEENSRDLLVGGDLVSIAAVRYMESLVSLQR